VSSRRTHPRFLELAAARLDGLLDPAEAAALDAHLAACDACRERIAGYEADRAAMRGLRSASPDAPRDLWARTSAALDAEASRRAAAARPAVGAPRRWIPLRPARGAYAAAVAALVIVALLGSGVVPGLIGPRGSFVATATPLAVEPGVIAYFSSRDGDVGVYMGRIASVCPEAFEANCQPIDSDVTKVASFAKDFVPQQLAVSPDGKQAAVVGTSSTGGAVYAVRFPELSEPSPRPTGTATASAVPTSANVSPTATPKPTTPTETVGPTVTVRPSSTGEPEAIIDHVVVVGEPPAYSPDGGMLAFSAMPADGSAGPDIYVWRIEDQRITRLTEDAGSIFASWAGGNVVGSRGKTDGSGEAGTASPVSFVVDAATGKTRDLARPAWRPIVDPTGHNVIYWDGTLDAAADGRLWQERRGGLYLAPWSSFDPAAEPVATPAPSGSAGPTAAPTAGGTPAATSASPSPSASAVAAASASASPPTELSTEAPTTSPSLEPSPRTSPPGKATPAPSGTATTTPVPGGEPSQLLSERDYATEPVLSWEVRWSPDGEWFGAWIGDRRSAAAPETGSLTVGAVDRSTGLIDPELYQLKEAPAVRGFALGDHRIAWATLPGADGKSEVRVLVWTETGRGTVRTTPGGNDRLPAL
jgi:hypothetical protein